MELAKIELNNIRLGSTKKVNYEIFEDLLDYREILEYSKQCSDCYKNIDVTSNINKLLNTIC